MSEEKAIFYDFGDFRLDTLNCRLLKNGAPVQITQKSFEILQELIVKRDRMLKKEELLRTIWEESYVEEATLTQHIYMLRKVLQQNGKVYIETVPKYGYRFVADVREINFAAKDLNGAENFNPAAEVFSGSPAESISEPTGDFDETEPLPIKAKQDRTVGVIYKRIAQISTSLCVLAVLIGLYFYLRENSAQPAGEPSPIRSIAVLPFQQIAEQKDEKLGLGLADVLITKLGTIENLEVLPTSAIIRYAEKDNYNLLEAGKNLGVDAVLTGTIQRDGEIIRVTVQFYKVQTQSFVWSEKFDERFSNIFLLQDAISERISKQLALRLNVNSVETPIAGYTKNIQAHQAYSMGLYHWNSRTEEGLKKASVYFRDTINLDPSFALAYAYLADTLALTVYYGMNPGAKEEALQRAKELARKALELDPNCSEAMTALATINTGENRIEESFTLLNKAIEIKPNNVAARQRISWMHAQNGDLARAVEEMQTAQNLDPQSRATNIGLAQLLNVARRPEESVQFSHRVLELNPKDEKAKLRLAESFEQKGNLAEAEKWTRQILREQENNLDAVAALSRILAKKNERTESLELLGKIAESKNAKFFSYETALVLIVFGENEKAISLLKKSAESGGFIKLFLKNDYNLDPLRQNPEFIKMIN